MFLHWSLRLPIHLGVATSYVRSPLFLFINQLITNKNIRKTKNVYVSLISNISNLKTRELLRKDKLM